MPRTQNGHSASRSNQLYTIAGQNSNTQAPSLNEYGRSYSYVNKPVNTPIQHDVLPPISRQKGQFKSGFKFNRTFLIIPLVAFVFVVIIAAICGVIFGVLYQPHTKTDLTKNEFSSPQAQPTTKTTTLQALTNEQKATTKSSTLNPVSLTSITTTTTTTTTTTSTTTSSVVPTISSLNLSAVCGIQPVRPNLNSLRIIKGNQAVPHSWPWVVSIGYNGPRTSIQHACGGALINKRTLITATHCVEEKSVYALVGNPSRNPKYKGDYLNVQAMVRVYVGINKRSSDINKKRTYRVARILKHSEFNSATFKNDITIITLDRDIEESDETGFICVERQTQTTPGTQVYAVGWGFTENNWFRASDQLMQVSFPIKSRHSCGLSYIPVYQFCAGDHVLGKDTCNGDSGGPLMTYVNNRFVLTGVVSNGDAACSGKGIYTNVALYYDWIMENS